MISPRPTDARLARVLATHVPTAAPDGLRARIFTAVEKTPQVRPVPALVAPLFDADPSGRRRSLLVAAALLIALALATAAVVGSLVELRRPPLEVDAPDDPAAYLETAYLHLADLPAFRMVGLESGDRHDIYSDGSGTIRDERLSTNTTHVTSRDRAVLLSVDPENHRTLIDLGPLGATSGQELRGYTGLSARCDGIVSYGGQGSVLGRQTHRIRCDDVEYWIDVETLLVLRSAVTTPSSGPEGPGTGPTAAAIVSWEVVELALGPQRADLFSFEPPDGFEVVRADDQACRLVWFAECVDPVANPGSPVPYVTPPPVADASAPLDLAAFVAGISEAYAKVPALDLVIESSSHRRGDLVLAAAPFRSRHFADGTGRFRTELEESNSTIYITTGGHIWIRYQGETGPYWTDDKGPYADHGGVGDIMLGFDPACETGWRYVGVDLIMGRPAVRIACDGDAYWVDRERSLIVRHESHPTDPLEPMISTEEIVALELRAQPPGLFDLPEGAVVSTTWGDPPSTEPAGPSAAP